MLLTVATLCAGLVYQDPVMETVDDSEPPPIVDGGPLPFDDQVIYQDDPNPVEVHPLYTVRPGTPGRSAPAGPGRVTYTLTGPARITVRIPFVGARTAILGPGTSYTGRDANNNGIPDDLDRREIDIGPV